ncbi:uncharacterized protein PAC_11838 [Phialocephala subalpina]|uniref:Uncharacterized protein n=1 Tax=Phialocephala subalpina TaxID=576137 RepID=A0A1L7XA89_9HELO|nr:uncharacterized protein PAC_11838 [Phialocephala subalpina]
MSYPNSSWSGASSVSTSLTTIEEVSASPYFSQPSPLPAGIAVDAELEAEFHLRRRIYADIMVCPGDDITTFANRYDADSSIANANYIRPILIEIERRFGSDVFGVNWEFHDHLKKFTTRCEKLRERIKSFYPNGLRVGPDGKPVEYPDNHLVGAGEKVVTSTLDIIKLTPKNSHELDRIHDECLSSLQESFDELLKDEMQARYLFIAEKLFKRPGVLFFFHRGLCRYQFTAETESEQLILTRHDLARAFVREVCRTAPVSVSPTVPSTIENLFSDNLSHGRPPFQGWDVMIKDVVQEQEDVLNWLPRIMAGRFGVEVISNPKSIFQGRYQTCKKALSDHVNTLDRALSLTTDVKWLIDELRDSVKDLLEFMLYHNGALLIDCVERRLDAFLRSHDSDSSIDGRPVDLCWNKSHLTGGLYQPTSLGISQWEKHLKHVQARGQRSLVRDKPPPAILTYALDFYNTGISSKKSRKESLYGTTTQSAWNGSPHQCAGPGCGPCKVLPMDAELQSDYSLDDDTELDIINAYNEQSDSQSDRTEQSGSTKQLGSTAQPEFVAPVSTRGFDSLMSEMSSSPYLRPPKTRWENSNQYNENISVEEDAWGPAREVKRSYSAANWAVVNRGRFEDMCKRHGVPPEK